MYVWVNMRESKHQGGGGGGAFFLMFVMSVNSMTWKVTDSEWTVNSCAGRARAISCMVAQGRVNRSTGAIHTKSPSIFIGPGSPRPSFTFQFSPSNCHLPSNINVPIFVFQFSRSSFHLPVFTFQFPTTCTSLRINPEKDCFRVFACILCIYRSISSMYR